MTMLMKRQPEHLLERQAADKIPDGQAVRLGGFVNIIGREQARRAGHVIDHRGGIAGNVFSDMPGDHARVCVEATARSETDNQTDRFSFVKIFLGEERQGLDAQGENDAENRQ